MARNYSNGNAQKLYANSLKRKRLHCSTVDMLKVPKLSDLALKIAEYPLYVALKWQNIHYPVLKWRNIHYPVLKCPLHVKYLC